MADDAAPVIHVPGILDIITVNENDGTISVLIGNGDGTFQTQTVFAAPVGPSSIAVGDINGDGFLDLVAADYGFYDSHTHTNHPGNNDVIVYLGNGAGGFTPASGSPVSMGAGTGPFSVTAADVNGDGFADIMTANYASNNISVRLSNGDGTFAAVTHVNVGTGPDYITYGDFNNDGKVDLAVSNFNNASSGNTGSISILQGNGSGGFTLASTVSTGIGPQGITLGDINGDGFTDIAVADYNINTGVGNVRIAFGNGNSTFQTPINVAVSGNPRTVGLGDVNGDGHLDMVVGNVSGTNIDVLLGNGAGAFSAASGSPINVSATIDPTATTLADVNRDGKLDIVVSADSQTGGAGKVGVLLGNGNGTFQALTTYGVGNNPFSLAVASLVPLTTTKNHALVFSSGNANAITVSDVDGGTETMTLSVAHGTLTLGSIVGLTGLSGNGSTTLQFSGTIAQLNTALNGLTYTPSNNYHGTDSVHITIDDNGAALPASSRQDIFVQNVNVAPVANADVASVNEAGTVSAAAAGVGVLANDTDSDSDPLTVSAFHNAASVSGIVGNALAGTYGTLTINANGTYSYTAGNGSAIALASFGSHPTDVFTYTANDGNGGTASATLTFTINRLPTLVADNPSGQALEGGVAITGNVLTNDGDHDGDTITVSAVNGSGGNVGNSIAGTYGHITIGSNGAYSYTADNTVAIDAGLTGSHLIDAFTYTANDGHGGTATQTITATIDRAPTVLADLVVSQAVESGAAVTGNVLTNDSDRDGDTLVVSVVSGSAGNVGNSVATAFGHITINANGSYSYTADNTVAIDALPTGSHRTEATSYTASDGHGGTNTINVVVTIDRGPTAVADAPAGQVAVGGAAVTGNVLTNDSDRDGDSLTVSAVAGSGGNVGNSVATTYGHITINADGSYSYTADNTAAIDAAPVGSHPTDVFTYTASDGHGGTTDATLSFTIDRPPLAHDDAFTTDELTAIGAGLNLFDNNGSGADLDPDGAGSPALVVGAVTGGTLGTQFALPSGALLTVNADGSFAYDPNHAFDSLHLAAPGTGAANTSTTDTFTYTLANGTSATATVTVNGINNANTIYEGSGGSDVITGDATLGGLYHLEQGGEDNVTGGSANDGFYFGAEFTAGDIVNGGGGSNNQIGLEGDYTAGVILSGSEITGIQTIAMLPGFDYTLSTDGTLTTAGQAFSFWSVKLGSGNHVNIDVHLEAGNISFFLGQGDDIAIGGSGTDLFFGEGGADTLTGNGGADTFAYFSTTTDSNGAGGSLYDTITDFTAGTDKIELFGTHVSTVDTAVSGDLSDGTFDSDLAAVLGNGATDQLNQGHAVLFTATGGGLSGETFLIVGTAGAASGYTAAADYVIHLQGAGFAGLAPGDFL